MIAKHQLKDEIWKYLSKQFKDKLDNVDCLSLEGIKQGLKDKNISDEEVIAKLDELKNDGSVIQKNIDFSIYCPKDKLDKLPKNYEKHFYSNPDTFVFVVSGVIILYIILYFFDINITEKINLTTNGTFLFWGFVFSSLIIIIGMIINNLYTLASDRLYILKYCKNFIMYSIVSFGIWMFIYFIIDYFLEFEDFSGILLIGILTLSMASATGLVMVIPKDK